MAFEKFTNTGQSFSAKVSINNSGMIGFNRASRSKYKMDSFKYAVLYYDKETQRIGVSMTNNEHEEGVLKIRFGDKYGANLGAKSFCEYYGITPKITSMYEISINESNWLIIDLNTARLRKSNKVMDSEDSNQNESDIPY